MAQFMDAQGGYEIRLGSRRLRPPPSWLPDAEVVETRWMEAGQLTQACDNVDAVVHLAGMNAQDCIADSVAAMESNGLATALLLQAAVHQGVSRFLYLSTAHVYGSPLSGVINEETCPINLHPYATSHRAGEDVVRFADSLEDIESVVLRLSNAFGAPADNDVNCWMLLVNDLCRQAVVQRRLVLRTAGYQRRNFIGLLDVARAVTHMLTVPNVGGRVFNIGGRWTPRIYEVAELIQSRCSVVLGFCPEIVRPQENDEEKDVVLDYRIDRLLKTGFRLKGSCISEVDATLQLCQSHFLLE